MKTKRLLALLLALSFLFLAGCRSEPEPEPEPVPTPVPTPEATPEPTPEPTPVIWTGPRNPLTGEPIEEDISAFRPWAILLDNLRAALPHNGISQADILYEMPVEGGITRILAVFQDIRGVGEIGPVRSARSYFLDAVQGHDALFVHAGGSPQAYADIRGRGVPNIDGVLGTGREFFRDPERSRRAGSEHSMMTTDELLLANLERHGFRLEHEAGFSTGLAFQVDDNTTTGGMPGTDVTVRFSNYKTGEFAFDQVSGRYYVSQYGAPMMDGAIDEQLSVMNVLVLFANFSTVDGQGRLAVDLNRGGEGYFFTGGYALPILWEKGGHTAPFLFSFTNGYPLELSVGNTYVNIINTNTGELTFN